jgi:hypothetical protein
VTTRRDCLLPRWCLGAWALLLLFAAFTIALDAQVFDKPLTDADLGKLLPLVAAEASDLTRLREQADRDAMAEKTRQAAREAAAREIVAGRVDPFGWLERTSKNAVVPSTARYQAACSKEASERAPGVAAVFTFGVPAPDSWLAVLAGGASQGAARAGGEGRPRGLNAESVAQQARAFYSARTFDPQGERAAFEWVFLSPDRLVTASVHGVNPYRALPACSALASGPTIVLSGAPRAFGPDPASPRATRTFPAALDAAGMNDVDYQSLKFQLTMARHDARDPASLADTPPGGADPSTSREKNVRKQNADLYRRYAAKLDPLLDQLIK